MTRRAWVFLGLPPALALLAAIGAVAALPWIELGGLVATRASAALGRDVTVEGFRVVPGRLVRVEVRGARLANIPGGSAPHMATIGRLAAELELLPLLRGSVVVRRAEAEGFTLLLERDHARTRNWRFGDPGAPPARGPDPAGNRRSLPMLHVLHLADGEIVVRTSSGQALRTRIHSARLDAADREAPVMLAGEGAYNDVPVTLQGRLGSFAAFDDRAKPFPMELDARSGDTEFRFQGTATDPLNVDGLHGRAELHAGSPSVLLRIGGAPVAGPAVSLAIKGELDRTGDRWRLTKVTGAIGDAPFHGPLLVLVEGPAGRPDSIVAELEFTRLDVNLLVRGPASHDAHDATDLPLAVALHPDPLLRVRLAAREVLYRRLVATEAALHAELVPGRITVESAALKLFGARFQGSGSLHATETGARAEADLHLVQGELDVLRQAFGTQALPLSGPIEARLAVTSEAATLNRATAGAKVDAVVAMRSGTVAREVIEMASTDIRALFRTARGRTPLSCLLAVVEMEGGRGEAAPLRIRAGTGTIAGAGRFDLNRRWVDLVIGSQSETTDFWALDVPVRVSGSWADPDIAPAQWSAASRNRLGRPDDVRELPPALAGFARANPCYRGRR